MKIGFPNPSFKHVKMTAALMALALLLWVASENPTILFKAMIDGVRNTSVVRTATPAPATTEPTGSVRETPLLGADTQSPELPWSLNTTNGTEMAATSRRRPCLQRRPWFLAGGALRPTPAPRGRRLARLWPQEAPDSDRILDQLMFVPPEPLPGTASQTQRLKKVLIYHDMDGLFVPPGRHYFLQQKCPVHTCTVTWNRKEAADAELIIFKRKLQQPDVPRPPRQIWLLYTGESPHPYGYVNITPPNEFNWTATYRRDSDIPFPYARWMYYEEGAEHKRSLKHNYAASKTKMVAWFVSNCRARSTRLQYAHELKKHIAVDIYGKCGTLKCPRNVSEKCLNMLDRDYKFYLAFESTHCKDYITEKLFDTALRHNVLPIVMGPRQENYARVAPFRSYIHVDDFESPRHLAAYLHRVDKDDDLYNSYFRWKGSGEFINTYFFCRLCAMLHDDFREKSYSNINDWRLSPGICTESRWMKK